MSVKGRGCSVDHRSSVAHVNLWRGDSVGAIGELLRAAELSPAGADRARRLAEAAYLGETVTGDMHDVGPLLDAARHADPEHAGGLAGAVAHAYYLLNSHGDVVAAHQMLVRAIKCARRPSGCPQQKFSSRHSIRCCRSATSVAARSCGNRSMSRSAGSHPARPNG
jgi:hypothetical protein